MLRAYSERVKKTTNPSMQTSFSYPRDTESEEVSSDAFCPLPNTRVNTITNSYSSSLAMKQLTRADIKDQDHKNMLLARYNKIKEEIVSLEKQLKMYGVII